jgi:putative glutamine amidotransferase
MTDRPRIVLTVAVPAGRKDPDLAERKNRLYAEAIARQGGGPVLLDATSTEADRVAAFATMDGLVLTGGADIDPARYGCEIEGSVDIEPDRDNLEADAWRAALERDVPVLGICRGFQYVNVLSGGTLVQHLDGHEGPGWSSGPATMHPLRVVPGTRLARILFPTNVGGGVLQVNSYHHQGVRPADLAPGLVVSAVASSALGDLVEGVESRDGRFLMAVQCHPERVESTPDEFDRLWRVFVDACRGPLTERRMPAEVAGTTAR